MTEIRRKSLRTFFTVFAVVGCAVGLAVACGVIEYNMQKTTYGRVDFGWSYRIDNGEIRLTDSKGNPLDLVSEEQKAVYSYGLSPVTRWTEKLLQWEMRWVADEWSKIAARWERE